VHNEILRMNALPRV